MTELKQAMTTKERSSYCIGLQTAVNLKQQFSDIDFDPLRGKPRPLGRGQERQQRNWIFG